MSSFRGLKLFKQMEVEQLALVFFSPTAASYGIARPQMGPVLVWGSFQGGFNRKMDEIRSLETLVCWYLQGNHQEPGFLDGAKWTSSIHHTT